MRKTMWALGASLTLGFGLLLTMFLLVGGPVAAAPGAITPIYDVQYTTDSSGDSPLVGQVVTTTGTVYATYAGKGFCIADDSGPWHGIYVYMGSGALPAVGDLVQAKGLVQEYYNLTELFVSSNPLYSYTVLSSGNPAPSPTVVTAAQIEYNDSASEPYESVFVEVHNLQVTAEADIHYIWSFSDASLGTGKADDWGYRLQPAVGDRFAILRGALIYDFSEYKVMPRNAADIVEPAAIAVQKDAPATVLPGDLFTYTLTVFNYSGTTLNQVVLTDALPLDVEIGAISNGGEDLGGKVVSWTIASLANGAFVTRTVAVTAPAAMALLVNDDYGVWAGNWSTRTTGSAVSTLVNEPGGVVPIHTVQGSGLASPLNGLTGIVIEGVVVGDFQNTSTQLSGFFLQEEGADADADPLTSEGIFVYDNGFGVDVSMGDVVRVQGAVNEYLGLTEIRSLNSVVVYSSGVTVSVAAVDLPVTAIDDLERYEGMLVTFPDVLYATESYELGHYGEVWVSIGNRLFNPTNVTTPGAAAVALQQANDLSRLLIDDGSDVTYPDPVPYLAADNTLRLGDTVTGLTGVLSYGSNYYRLQPTAPVTFTRENPRTAAPPEMGGTFKVASFNVLNYFNGDGQGGGFPTSRGANTLAEFVRQRAKIIAAIVAIDADVIGLMEIENDGYGTYSAIQDLVNGLNDATAPGTYAFIDFGGPVGTDEIIQGLLYKPGTVTPIGAPAVLDSSVDPTFLDTKNRPVLAQTFEHNASGEQLTVAVNHLKSKGSDCNDVGDPDTGDGQGNCNGTRTDAAIALTNWLAGDPTGSGDPDALIIGDLNAYAMEDPITAIKSAGYTNLIETFVGPEAYSYVFEGQSGYLDHALASASLTPQVAGATDWHINSDEPRILDYNQENNPPSLYQPDAYRASDHDPVVVSLFAPASLTLTKGVTPLLDVKLGSTVTYTLALHNGGFFAAHDVELFDSLPAGVLFDAWVTQNGAQIATDTITWTGVLSGGEDVSIVFTAVVTDDAAYQGQAITNTAWFTSTDGGGGTAEATFWVAKRYTVFLPLIARNQ